MTAAPDAQQAAPTVGAEWTLAALPYTLRWDVAPVRASDEGDVLTITAGPQTDLFRDPRGEVDIANSPRLLFAPDARFTLQARVAVDFRGTYDAGVLMIHASPDRWAKLCFELSPQGEPMVVTVVTVGTSDDANAVPVADPSVLLRVSGLGSAYAFHYSVDGVRWHLVRYFSLGEAADVRSGFSAQAPVGDSCTARFSDIAYTTTHVTDIRSDE